MKFFYYGNFQSKINEKISEYLKKTNSTKLDFELNEENITEIISNLNSENLFGEKFFYSIDITESEVETISRLIQKIPAQTDLVLKYQGELAKSSKILKLFDKEFSILEFKKPKEGNTFNFIDYLLAQDAKKSYQELINIKENEVLIFNNIISLARNILSLKYDLDCKSKIVPFKIGLYKKYSANFTNEGILEIYNNLYKNDLKFKKGEITSEMLLIHSMNLFLLNKNGNSK